MIKCIPFQEEKMAKTRKIAKPAKIRLTRKQVEQGISGTKAMGAGEVPLRKLNLEALLQVKSGWKALIVTDYRKAYAVLLPLAA